MSINLLRAALQRINNDSPPIWLMRQAGRYHSHYQALRRQHSFIELCKTPALAAEVAMGPMHAFDFDAAILFSDILFPLEVLGQPLDFNPGPQLGFQLRSMADIERLQIPAAGAAMLGFQAEALRLTRQQLRPHQGLIGFVGAPLTLFVFAVEGSHKHGIDDAIQGLRDGRFAAFMEKLLPLLTENMVLQARALGADALDMLAMFDSCAGDIPADLYREIYLPYLERILQDFQQQCPATPVLYYGKGLPLAQLAALNDLPIQALGLDHAIDLPEAFMRLGERFVLQGNLDPVTLTYPEAAFETAVDVFLERVRKIPRSLRQAWICGLGHGVTPQASEANVRRLVQRVKQIDAQ